jgi:hypothetical protein
LFGAGQGTTLGSYAPRVSNFLATLAPDIGQAKDQALVAVADRPAPNVERRGEAHRNGSESIYPSSPWSPPNAIAKDDAPQQSQAPRAQLAAAPADSVTAANETPVSNGPVPNDWYESLKSALAILGLVAIASQLVKAVR